MQDRNTMTGALRMAALAATMAICIAAGLVALPAKAQPLPQAPQQIELSGEMVEGFLASYPEIEALGEEFEREYGSIEAEPEDPAGAPMAYARYAEAKERMEALLADHGIASMEEWAQIVYSVMVAYSFAEGGADMASMDREMAEAIDQIRGDSSIPAAQKEQLVAMLEQQMAHLGQLQPPAGNVDLVGRYSDRIRMIVDHEEE